MPPPFLPCLLHAHLHTTMPPHTCPLLAFPPPAYRACLPAISLPACCLHATYLPTPTSPFPYMACASATTHPPYSHVLASNPIPMPASVTLFPIHALHPACRLPQQCVFPGLQQPATSCVPSFWTVLCCSFSQFRRRGSSDICIGLARTCVLCVCVCDDIGVGGGR